MHIVKPSWLTHGDKLKDYEVYSCHVSSDGKRLVTAAGDGYVRIWSTQAVYAAIDGSPSEHRQLAAISNHSGTIHTVRFSGNGKYLASGADDKIVCVYVLDPNRPTHASTFGTNEPPPVENWRAYRRLIGHENDVQDLGWSYDSSILVSVGLDSKVVVWSGHNFEKLKTLPQHQSHVKGITFDPANKYFATASDDRTIKIFRFNSPPPNATPYDQINNFVLECTVVEPFKLSPLTTYFRRCSWSPDGNHIAAANAVNGPVSSVAVINRGNWDSDINLIGHEGPVEVCAFSPRMFHRHPLPDNVYTNGNVPPTGVTVIACAGQDKSLSIWNTSSERPFVITHELAGKSISDLAWDPNGETLFLTSLDGSIMAAVFEPGELGYPAPVQDNELQLKKFGAGRKAGIIEGTEALLLEESSKADELRGVQGRMGELMGDGAQAAPTTNGTKTDSRLNGTTPSSSANGQTGLKDKPASGQQPAQDPRVERLKQRVTITKDGKKRIAPMLVSSSSGVGESSLPQTQLVSGTTAAGGIRSDSPHNILDLSKPYDGFPKGGLPGLLIGNKRKFADIEGDSEKRVEKGLAAMTKNGAASIVVNSTDGLIPPGLADLAPQRSAIMSNSISASQIRLAIPLVRVSIVRTIDGSEPPSVKGGDKGTVQLPGGETVLLEAKNATGPSRTGRIHDRDPTRISCMKRGQVLWQDYVPKAVLLLTGNSRFWAAACEDGSIHVWTPAGRRLLNPLVLEAQPVILDCRGPWLLCIVAVGNCYVWNMDTVSSPHPPVSLGPILDIAIHAQGPHLTPSPSLVFARLNSQGRIVAAMSNGDGYVYSPALYVWQRLSEPWWAVGSQYWNTTDSSVGNLQSASNQGKVSEEDDQVSPENLSAGVLPILERSTSSHTLLRGRAFYLQRLVKALISAEGFEGFESSVSIAHLENRLAAALTLRAKEEFRVYLLMYAKRLGVEGLKGKIEELLRSLSSSLFEEDDGNDSGQQVSHRKRNGLDSTDTNLCGWDKKDLLKEVVISLGKHRDLQRTIVTYAKLLDVIPGPGDEEMTGVESVT